MSITPFPLSFLILSGLGVAQGKICALHYKMLLTKKKYENVLKFLAFPFLTEVSDLGIFPKYSHFCLPENAEDKLRFADFNVFFSFL